MKTIRKVAAFIFGTVTSLYILLSTSVTRSTQYDHNFFDSVVIMAGVFLICLLPAAIFAALMTRWDEW